MKLLVLLVSILTISSFSDANERSKSISADSIQVLKIAGQDERAVIKTPDGKMRLISVGDRIGDHVKVVEIAHGRVVLEEKKNETLEKVIIRLENGQQRVERLAKVPDQQAPTYFVNPANANPAAAEKKSMNKEQEKNRAD